MKGLNIGAGPVRLESNMGSLIEWENSDFADTESAASWKLEKLRDFTKPFEDIEDNSIDFIVAWHIIEHVGLHENGSIVKEWARMLKPGGKIFIACPNIREIAKNIVNPQGPWLDPFICMVNIFGPYNGYVGDYHKWGYFVETLSQLLRDNGFSEAHSITQYDLAQKIGNFNAMKLGFADYNIQLEATK